METGLPTDLLRLFWEMGCTTPFRGSYAECSDISYCSDVQGSGVYVLTTLLEVHDVVASWEQVERCQDEYTCLTWSYTIHARRSGRIILHISYRVFSEE